MCVAFSCIVADAKREFNSFLQISYREKTVHFLANMHSFFAAYFCIRNKMGEARKLPPSVYILIEIRSIDYASP